MKTIISCIIVFSLLSTLNNNCLSALNLTGKSTSTTTVKGFNLTVHSQANTAGWHQNNYSSNPYLRLQLAKDAINTDDLMIIFKSNATNGYDPNKDAPYFMGNGQVNLCSISSDNVDLAINALPLPKKTVAVRLKVEMKTDGAYALNLTQLSSVPALFDIWLMDAYKKDSVNLRRKASYNFSVIKSDTNSYGAGRFTLVIRQNPALAVHLSDFSAKKATNGTELVWDTENEQDYTNFTVQRSTDKGETFNVIDSLISSATGAYNFTDNSPMNGTDEYRLKLQDITGTISYSDIVTLTYGKLNNVVASSPVSIYPNPVTATLNLTINPVVSANLATTLTDGPDANPSADASSIVYRIKIVSTTNGAVIKTSTTDQQMLQTDVSGLIPGTYVIQVLNNKDNSLVGKSTFIKL